MTGASSFDVVVVGAGPAGALAAYHLQRGGARTLLIDAQSFPREKPCGGGIQERCLQHMPFDISEMVRSTIRNFRFTYRMAGEFVREYPETLVRCVRRRDFDHFLLKRARAAGATVREATTVSRIEPRREKVQVEAGGRVYSAGFLVGADGANSVVARRLNARDAYFWQTALYAEVELPAEAEHKFQNDTICVDWGTLQCGYGWIFPKSGLINAGVGGATGIARMLRGYFRDMLEQYGLGEHTGRFVEGMRGHQLPTWTPRVAVAGECSLLVGDAAGFVEPLTGEGISYACHSAALAAQSILGAGHAAAVMERYREMVAQHIARDLAVARLLLRLSITFPRSFYWLFRRSERVWGTFCQVLRGERRFSDLQGALLGPLSGLLSPGNRWLERREEIQLRQLTEAAVRPGRAGSRIG